MEAIVSIEELNLGDFNIYLHPFDLIQHQSCFLSLNAPLPKESILGASRLDGGGSSFLDYSKLTASVTQALQKCSSDQDKRSAYEIAKCLIQELTEVYPILRKSPVSVSFYLSKSLPYCECLTASFSKNMHMKLNIENLHLDVLIGLNAWESKRTQPILVSLELSCPGHVTVFPIDYFYKKVSLFAQQSDSKTLERFVYLLGNHLKQVFGLLSVHVKISKPWGNKQAKNVSISFRTSTDKAKKMQKFPSNSNNITKYFPQTFEYFLALGSNLDSRKKLIEEAVKKLLMHEDIQLIDTSFLYESRPMYLSEQPLFLNCVILIKTALQPAKLLTITQLVEHQIGRAKNIINGPRRIDIDILYCRNKPIIYQSQDLILPHSKMLERAFVLRPILDIDPFAKDPLSGLPLSFFLDHISDHELMQVFVLRERVFPISALPALMGILNVTPDSFSDGNRYLDKASAIKRVSDMVSEGMDILDIGGQSTRPGSEAITPAEEISRLQEIIPDLRIKFPDLIVSLDTYYSNVVSKFSSSIDLVNDVSGGLLDESMLTVVAKAGLPIVLSHIRGTPATMNSFINSYTTKLRGTTDIQTGAESFYNISQESRNELKRAFVKEVIKDIEIQVNLALKSGIYRWNIIVDPGIGFAKSTLHNMVLLEYLPIFRPCDMSFPIIIGCSRKRFIAEISEASGMDERLFGSMAASLLPESANFVRIHDIKPYRQFLSIKKCLH